VAERVPAGVTTDEVRKDYRVLYKYPAASSPQELISLSRLLLEVVPQGEMKSVMTAQRSLIDNAQDLLVNGKYVP
jgi:hypothetical protein